MPQPHLKPPYKKRAYDLVQHANFDLTIAIILLISLIIFFIDSAFHLDATSRQMINIAEWILTTFFVLEYLLRFYAAPVKKVFFTRHLIDLLAILPILRFFRLFRMIRLLKLIHSDNVSRWISAFNAKSKFFSVTLQESFFEIFLVGVILITLLFVGSLGILSLERGANEQFKSLADGLWWTVVTLTTVGYGDKFPVTFGGKLLAIALMFTGLSFFALITSFISSFIIETYRRGARKGMDLTSLNQHIVICGHNHNAIGLLNELTTLYKDDMKFKVIICEEALEEPLDRYSYFLQADFTKMANLEKAQISRAEAVIVLADKSQGRTNQDADARTILTVLGIKKHFPETYVCAEVLSPANTSHIQNAGVDEFITPYDYTGNLLAQTVANRGIASVYRELLQSHVGNQLTLNPVEPHLVGYSFQKLGQFLAETEAALLIGLQRNRDFHINPGSGFIIESGDQAIVLKINPQDPTTGLQR